MFYGSTMQFPLSFQTHFFQRNANSLAQLGLSQSSSSFELVSARTTMSPSLAMFSWVQFVQSRDLKGLAPIWSQF